MVLEQCKWEGAAVSSALGHSVEPSMGRSYGRRARAGSWQGGTIGRVLGLPLRGRVEEALDGGNFRVGEPVQPEPRPQES